MGEFMTYCQERFRQHIQNSYPTSPDQNKVIFLKMWTCVEIYEANYHFAKTLLPSNVVT